MWHDDVNIADMVGQTMISVMNVDDEELVFKNLDGKTWTFYHSQDCCEHVYINDICGDLNDLVGAPLLVAEEVTNADEPPCNAESYTWTFYKFATIKGSVTVRWLGTSNGYYSEGVSLKVG